MHDFAPAEPEWTLPYPSQRMPTLARRGIVATSQVLAAQAGTEILARGGNAVDAAIATAACMTVLEPTTNGIGGDAFALVWSPPMAVACTASTVRAARRVRSIARATAAARCPRAAGMP